MENQTNDIVETTRDALDGMAVRVNTQHSTKDLLKVGGLVVLGSVIGTAGYNAFASWMQRRKFKKTMDKINEELDQ